MTPDNLVVADEGKKISVKSSADDTSEFSGASLTQLGLGDLDLFGNPTSCPPSTPDCGVQPGGSDGRGISGDSDFNVYFYDKAGAVGNSSTFPEV